MRPRWRKGWGGVPASEKASPGCQQGLAASAGAGEGAPGLKASAGLSPPLRQAPVGQFKLSPCADRAGNGHCNNARAAMADPDQQRDPPSDATNAVAPQGEPGQGYLYPAGVFRRSGSLATSGDAALGVMRLCRLYFYRLAIVEALVEIRKQRIVYLARKVGTGQRQR